MTSQEFDKEFKQLCTEMVEIAYEFVDYNEEEVDTIYTYCTMEANIISYNVFYRINGELVRLSKINTVSNMQYDISKEKMFQLLGIGVDYLDKIEQLFIADEREVPTQMKMVYFPKTGEFDNQISYYLHFSQSSDLLSDDIFEQWFEEVKTAKN